ncbi:MAG: preprotein translocase subunit SecA [Rickettsiales bacterium]|nr:preprotein translocase subunit SecA [Rickettsiales bacterium]
MALALFKKFFGSANDRYLKEFAQIVNSINSKSEFYKNLSDAELKGQTKIFQKKIKEGGSLDDILVDAFAVCREAADRVLKMRHFDVQLYGGIALHRGMISEMKTGEGKTLVSTLAAYLNALTGKGVHIVTVNDYLASRDANWMGKIYEFLGLKVACITGDISDSEKLDAYNADILYGTNNEFGFDYLRDNLKLSLESIVQRSLNYAIIDEVDSILIDEARTPLIISGPVDDDPALYIKIVKIIPELKSEFLEIDEKTKTISLNDAGTDFLEELLVKKSLLKKGSSLYDVENVSLVHHVNQALRAEHLFKNEVDYIVSDNKILIIDEFTGRAMDGRRYSDGLHQALEAKEAVPIQKENQTLASTTFQNYFRNYEKLAGMTGTASTEASEFHSIYNLDVVSIPTHKLEKRDDKDDEIYKNLEQKYRAVIKQVKECYDKKQPVLLGTISIERSEILAKLLKKEKLPHNVLNAKQHTKEANIIAQAGRSGAITIATNMAGRGTDIMLGGNPEMLVANNAKLTIDAAKDIVAKEKEEVLKAGGLFVIGTERHESRRIDNQLRGRSGRQGDPGATKFFLSLEDDLMRIFGSEKMSFFLDKLGFKDDESIHHPWISRALEKAQSKVEGHNFEIRKTLLKYDDILNEQRQVIYHKRKEIIGAEKISGTILDFIQEINANIVSKYIPAKSYIENWDLKSLDVEIYDIYGVMINMEDFASKNDVMAEAILAELNKFSKKLIKDKRSEYGEEMMNLLEKNLMIMTLDSLWRDHLNQMDHLKNGINLRAYAQKDPLEEYKREAFIMFESMLDNLMVQVVKRIAHARISQESEKFMAQNDDVDLDDIQERKEKTQPVLGQDQQSKQIFVNKVAPEDRDSKNPESWGKVGRNENCPCGSGKKYKHCHGKI